MVRGINKLQGIRLQARWYEVLGSEVLSYKVLGYKLDGTRY